MATTGTSSPGRVYNPTGSTVKGTSAPGRVHNATGSTVKGTSAPGRTAPPKANAAPSVSKNIAIGLVEALNAVEEKLKADKVFEQANRYSIEFAPATLGEAKVTKGGKPNKAKVPMQQARNPADKVNPTSNSADYDVRTFDYRAGTPIVLILNEIVKNSTYIADQADAIIDEVTKKTKPQTPLGDLAWYKVSVQATPILPFDKKRRAFAQDIKYVISAYPINSMQSEYFPEGKIRGRHKSYKYWFTGQNTQVLKFSQEFNYLYHQTFTNPESLTQTRLENNRELPKREYQAAVAGSSSQGAESKTNSIGASAADYLYSKSDIANCSMTIVGDPAWIQQDELATGVDAPNFSFAPFNADGGINYDAQEIIFDVQWNPGVDYDLTGTGLANPNITSEPQAIYTYKANEVISRFHKGKFEQDIKGTFIDLLDAAPTTTDREPAAKTDAGVRPAAIGNAGPTFAETLRSTVTNPVPASPLAKGVQQILSPVTNGVNLTDAQLRNTPIYNTARRGGATDASAISAARAASAAGVNTYAGSVIPGIRAPDGNGIPQRIVKDQ